MKQSMFLFLVLLSLTASAKLTSEDSTEVALNNCSYQYDSLANAIVFKDSVSNMYREKVENNSMLISTLNTEISIRIDSDTILNRKINKLEESLKVSKENREKDRKKSKSSNVLTGTVAFTGGAVVGAIVVAVIYLIKNN